MLVIPLPTSEPLVLSFPPARPYARHVEMSPRNLARQRGSPRNGTILPVGAHDGGTAARHLARTCVAIAIPHQELKLRMPLLASQPRGALPYISGGDEKGEGADPTDEDAGNHARSDTRGVALSAGRDFPWASIWATFTSRRHGTQPVLLRERLLEWEAVR